MLGDAFGSGMGFSMFPMLLHEKLLQQFRKFPG
jgi:hypothetical protein